MRKKFIIASAPLALLLAACGGVSTPVGDKSGSDSVKAELKGNDTAPNVTFDTPIKVSEDTVKILGTGDGEEIKEGDRVTYRLAAFDGNTGKSVQETYSTKKDATLVYNDALKTQSKALYDGLAGQKKGATVAYIPKAETDDQRGVMVLTITDVQHAPSYSDMKAGAQFGDKATTDKVTAQWAADDWAPKVSIDKALKPAKDSARLFGEGSGETITDDMKLTLKTALIDIATGQVSQDAYPNGSTPAKPAMPDLKTEMPVLYQALKGQKVGQTVVYIPKAAAGQKPSAMVLTVTKSEAYHAPKVLSKDEVKKLRDAGKLPTIKENGAKKVPSITFPDKSVKAPQDLVVEVVKEGTGAVIKETDTVTANYSGWAWDSHKNFDQNFTAGKPTEFSLSQVIKGWTKGLTGQKVGSTVMIVVPKDWAYGDAGQGDAQGDLVFYVQITKTAAAKTTAAK